MNIVNPSAIEIYDENPQKHIERIARTCYKSNDLITDESNKKFINNLFNRNHWAMLEHFIFIYEVPKQIYELFIEDNNRYLICSKDVTYSRYVISFSARTILDSLNGVNKYLYANLAMQTIKDYNCYELYGNNFNDGIDSSECFKKLNYEDLSDFEKIIHGWVSIKFTCDRGVSHEIVRHRDASFAQESTRYCNYSKDKFGNEITVIKPLMFSSDNEEGSVERQKWLFWKEGIEASERAYFYLLDMGATPQEARSVLPNSLKTEVIMTTRLYEWAHFFNLRLDKAAHPQMREVAFKAFDVIKNKKEIILDYVSYDS